MLVIVVCLQAVLLVFVAHGTAVALRENRRLQGHADLLEQRLDILELRVDYQAQVEEGRL